MTAVAEKPKQTKRSKYAPVFPVRCHHRCSKCNRRWFHVGLRYCQRCEQLICDACYLRFQIDILKMPWRRK